MKHALRIMLMGLFALVSTTTFADTVTFTANTDKGTQTNAGVAGDEVTKDGITIKTTTGNSAFAAAQYRFSKSSVTTFSSTVGHITKVEFTCTASGTTKYGPGCFTDPSVGSYSANGKVGTWTGDAESFTLTASSNQVRATQIVVTYTPSGDTPTPSTLAAPTIDATGTQGSSDNFTNQVTVTLTAADGASIFYTLDGQDPDDREGIEYSAPFSLTATTTVKAIAYKDDLSSTIATRTFTKIEAVATTGDGTQANPYTAADVKALLDASQAPSDSVYVKGIVSQAATDISNYGDINFWISDDGTTTSQQVEAYNSKYYNAANYTDKSQIPEVGGTVVLYGKLTKYNSTYELGRGNRLISYTGPAVSAPDFSGETSFTESTTVTITAGEGSTIYYTVDGTEPTNASTQYKEPLTFTETTTLKAIAYKGGNASAVTTQTYTKVKNFYTVAEAVALGATTDSINVRGIVSTLASNGISTRYGNAEYYISDDGTTTTQLHIYRGNYLNGEKFTSTDQLQLGDTVVVRGKQVVYNNELEMGQGNYLTYLGRKAATFTDMDIPAANEATADNANVNFTFTNDKVAYKDGNFIYVRRGTGSTAQAIVLNNVGVTRTDGTDIQAGDVLNGTIKAAFSLTGSLIPTLKKNSENTVTAIATDDHMVDPTPTTVADVANHKADYIILKGTIDTLSTTAAQAVAMKNVVRRAAGDPNYYLHDGGSTVQFYGNLSKVSDAEPGVEYNVIAVVNGAYRGAVEIRPIEKYLYTGIDEIRTDTTDTPALDPSKPMYNLSGQRVGRGYTGIVLQKGKKFVVK